MKKVIFDKPYLVIYSDEEMTIIHLQWKKLATSEEFRLALDFAYDYVLKNGIKFWLANLKNMSVIKEADQRWTNQIWFPKISKTKIEKMAIVNSLDYFNQSAVQKIMIKADPIIGFETKYFNDLDEARNWLLNRD